MQDLTRTIDTNLDRYAWSIYDNAGTQDLNFFRSVPLSVKNDMKGTIFDYSTRGMKHFYPWFVSEKNSAKHTDVARNLLDLLPHLAYIIQEKKEYPFLRCDINIFMTLMKVHLVLFGNV